MTYEVKTKNTSLGWVATTECILEENHNVQRVLIAATWKPTDKLATNLKVVVRENQDGFITETYPLYGGFHKTINAVPPCKGDEEQDILQFHKRVLQKMDEIVEEAKAFYSNPNPENKHTTCLHHRNMEVKT